MRDSSESGGTEQCCGHRPSTQGPWDSGKSPAERNLSSEGGRAAEAGALQELKVFLSEEGQSSEKRYGGVL